MKAATLLLILLPACATMPNDPCGPLAREYRISGAIAALAGGLGGIGAIATISPDDEKTRRLLGVSAAISGAIAAASIFWRDDIGQEWATCTGTSTVAEDGAVEW